MGCQYKSRSLSDSRKIQKCTICDKEFKAYGDRVVCSIECFSKKMSKERLGENNPAWKSEEELDSNICLRCEKKFHYLRAGIAKGRKKVFCSLECRRGVYLRDSKENKEVNRERSFYPRELKRPGGTREQALIRDSNKCLMCESSDKVEVHHIDYNKKNSDIDNLMTLCKKCHGLTHHNRGFWEMLFNTLTSGSKVVKKGWGLEIHLVNHDKYCLKYLVFFKGKRFSLHLHNLKQEMWQCVWGKFDCYIEDNGREDFFTFKPGQNIEIMPGVKHQVEATKNSIIVEVSTRDYPEDSIRIEKGD